MKSEYEYETVVHLDPIRESLFCLLSVLAKNLNPRNTSCISPVEIFTCPDPGQNINSWTENYLITNIKIELQSCQLSQIEIL